MDGLSVWGIKDIYGCISISGFLRRFGVELDKEKYNSFKQNTIMTVFESILSLDLDVEHIASHFDKDGDGTVDMKELRDVLSKFDLGLTKPQLDSLIRSFFFPGSSSPCVSAVSSRRGTNVTVVSSRRGTSVRPTVRGTIVRKPTAGDITNFDHENLRIGLDDFLGRFVVTFNAAESLGDDAYHEQANGLAAIGRFLMTTPIEKLLPNSINTDAKGFGKMRSVFQTLDASSDGILQVEEFVDGLALLPGFESIIVDGEAFTRDKLLECAKALDTSNNGTINYLEFLQAFGIEDMEDDLSELLADHIITVLYRHRQAIRTTCRSLDTKGTGILERKKFHSVLECMNSALSSPERHLTSTQIVFLVDAIADADGLVDYEDFLKSFKLLTCL